MACFPELRQFLAKSVHAKLRRRIQSRFTEARISCNAFAAQAQIHPFSLRRLTCPKRFKPILVPQRIQPAAAHSLDRHRLQPAVSRKPCQRPTRPDGRIAIDPVNPLGRQSEKPTFDPGAIARGGGLKDHDIRSG